MKTCYFYLAWMALCMFVVGYCAPSRARHAEGGANGFPRLLRAPDERRIKKANFYGDTFLWATMFTGIVHLSISSIRKTRECSAVVDDFGAWVVLSPVFLGAFFVILSDMRKGGKMARNVSRLLTDCQQDGSMRAIYEMREETSAVSLWEWGAHDMRKDERDMLRLAKRAVRGYYYKPVNIVMNIPPEKVLQKLEQYNLITKYGYERLPPSKNDLYYLEGGSVVQFYYQAEYVRIWG